MPNWVALEDEKHAAKVKEKYNKLMVYTYIICYDKRRCGKLVEDLSNDYVLGYNKYPNDVINAQNMVINYNNNINNPNKRNKTSNNISFGHKGQVKDKRNITCFV